MACQIYTAKYLFQPTGRVFLSLNNVSFSVGKKEILKNISLAVHQLDKIALVGKNGVGKTTLLDIIGKKKSIDSGELWHNPSVHVGFLNQRDKVLDNSSVNKYLKSSGPKEKLFDQYPRFFHTS